MKPIEQAAQECERKIAVHFGDAHLPPSIGVQTIIAAAMREVVEPLVRQIKYGTATGEPCAEIVNLRDALEVAEGALKQIETYDSDAPYVAQQALARIVELRKPSQ